jgi:hypothetical protein
MKKLSLLFIAVILLAGMAKAQRKSEYVYIDRSWKNYISYDYTFDNEFKINNKKQKSKIAKAAIKEFTQTTQRGKKEYTRAKLAYDTKGNCISSLFNKKNGKIKKQFIFTYTPENLTSTMTMLNGKGKVLKKRTYKYNSDSLVTEWVFYNKDKEIRKYTTVYNKYKRSLASEYFKKGKSKAKTTSTYDSTRIMESYYYKKGSPDYKWKWIYTYYDDAKKTLKSSVIYKHDGTAKYTWNYDCKPEGELQSKHKDSTLICIKTEYDKDSNITHTYRKFDEKGKPQKIVSVWSKNRKMLEYTVYYDNDIPRYYDKYNKVTNDLEQMIFYNKKGKESWKNLNTFDSNNNIIETSYYQKGKFNGKSTSQFNTANFVTNVANYNKHNKIRSTDKFDYTFY